MTSLNLFEYKKQDVSHCPEIEEQYDDLEAFLNDIWRKRPFTDNAWGAEAQYDPQGIQRFLEYDRKNHTLKSNNYVGSIYFEDITINLIPKIFDTQEYNDDAILRASNCHVFWWLKYYRKIKVPNYTTGLSSLHMSSFLEIMIYLFAKETAKVLSQLIYQYYTRRNEETFVMKGKLNVSAYIQKSLVNGRWHALQCSYDKFEIDILCNQAIKRVAHLLRGVTKDGETQQYLDEILCILDEVQDVEVTAEMCDHIHIPIMFEDLQTPVDYCKLFLSHSVSFHYKDDLQLFAFLLPMEYVFEDFVYGFISRECGKLTAKSQSEHHLAEIDGNKCFQLRPDLVVNDTYIADTKYKLIYSDTQKIKDCIYQPDLYQMISYAVRLGKPEVRLFYPSTLHHQGDEGEVLRITVEDEFSGALINIEVHMLPIVCEELFTQQNKREWQDEWQDKWQGKIKDQSKTLKDKLLSAFP